MTHREKMVLAAITDVCEDDYSADMADVKSATGFDAPTIKGIVGSLVKKGKVIAEEEERDGMIFFDWFPVNDKGECLNFGEWT